MVEIRHRKTGEVLLQIEAPSLAGLKLSNVCLRGAMLAEADLSGAVLDGVDLTDADLRGAILSDAALGHCRMDNADLRRAMLAGSRVEGAFRHADFSGACLVAVVFGDADLDGADFRAADLRCARFDGARLTSVRLTGAYYDERTRWSGAIDPEAVGAERSAPPPPELLTPAREANLQAGPRSLSPDAYWVLSRGTRRP